MKTLLSNRSVPFAYATLGLVILLWAGNLIAGRAAVGLIPPFTLACVRWTGAALILLPFAWRHLMADWRAVLKSWPMVLLLGLCGVGAFNGFLYLGLNFTTATNSFLLQAATPALVMLFDRLFFAARAGRYRLAGVCLSICGVVYTLLRGDIANAAALRLNAGDIFVLAAVICWALYTSLLRLRPQCHPLSFLTATFAVGIAAMAPLSAYELATEPESLVLNGTSMAIFFYVAIFPSIVAYILYNAAVEKIGSVAAGQASTLMPLLGAFLAALLLGEELHAFHFVGMALILAGIAVGARSVFSR